MTEREVVEALVNCATRCDDTCPMKDEAWISMCKPGCRASYENSVEVPLALLIRTVELMRERPIHCAECAHCFGLDDENERRPYDAERDVEGFYCAFWDTVFYPPEKAENYYCGDAIKREAKA